MTSREDRLIDEHIMSHPDEKEVIDATCAGCEEAIYAGSEAWLLNDGTKVHDADCFRTFTMEAFNPRNIIAGED